LPHRVKSTPTRALSTVLSTVLLASAASFVMTAPAFAQTAQPAQTPGQAAGMRYLSWAGKTERDVTSAPRATTTRDGRRVAPIIPRRPVVTNTAPAAMADNAMRYPSVGNPYAASNGPTSYAPPPVNGLTPASAWLSRTGPRPTVASQPYAAQPYSALPEPQPVAMPAPAQPRPAYAAPARQPNPQPAARPVMPPTYPAPTRSPVLAPAPMAAAPLTATGEVPPAPFVPAYSGPAYSGAYPAAVIPGSVPAPVAARDPMAPRADAPIFRMGASSAQPAQPSAQPPTQAQQPVARVAANEPGRDSARYYSVHREAGHTPDPTPMPTSIFLDSAPIDLAEPPAEPTTRRTADGRAQMIVPNQDPSLP